MSPVIMWVAKRLLLSFSLFQGCGEIKANFPPSESGVLKWFENYVVGKACQLPCGTVIREPPRFPPDFFSVDHLIAEAQPQGNNTTQGWHSRLLKVAGAAHPGFWRFLCTLQREEAETSDRLEACLRVQQAGRQKKALRLREEKLMRPYGDRRHMATSDFLRIVAHNLKKETDHAVLLRANVGICTCIVCFTSPQ
ncbi:hypothetical protein HPB48_019283 [Haemaphysalis longicornis]|uniref:Secreted protein n=1 Tax=Haemaphysalis longicornis TaxID=44386 RepID=A0A9J6FAB8_HAELO|nr:hypothetical protein HPB48_019283 [Haemaphysalis longicornis]